MQIKALQTILLLMWVSGLVDAMDFSDKHILRKYQHQVLFASRSLQIW
jgi:hypothetical protein